MMERKKSGKGSPGVEDWKRTLRALGPQIDDPEALAQALEIEAELKAVIAGAVARLMDVDGYTFPDIARGAGLTRQGARWRWPLPGRPTPNEVRREAERRRDRARFPVAP